MTDLLILLGMGLGFAVIAWLADRLAVKHRWISKDVKGLRGVRK